MYVVEHLPPSNCIELAPLVYFEWREKASEVELGEQCCETKEDKSYPEELPSVKGTEIRSE